MTIKTNFFALLLTISFSAVAQQLFYPLDHDENAFIEMYLNTKKSNSHTSIKPYFYQDVKNIINIDSIDSTVTDTNRLYLLPTSKWAKFLNESPALFNQNPDFNVLKKYLQQSGDYEDGSLDFAIDGYIEAVKRDFEAGGTRRSDYDDYEMDDYVEDFDNWFTEKMDS